MKKNSRKHRKLQKEQAMRANQVQQKAGAPFSKRKIRECRHEGVGRDLETFKRHRYTHLQPISDKECQCSECKVIFPIELYEKSCISDMAVSREVLEMSLRPVRYYHVAEDKIEYLKPDEDPRYEKEQAEIEKYIEIFYVEDETTGKLNMRAEEDINFEELQEFLKDSIFIKQLRRK